MGLFSRKQSESPPGDRDTPSSARRTQPGNMSEEILDPAAMLKKRARRRLVGAIALVLGAIVFLPMVFDSEPQQIAEDIDIRIPDRETPLDAGSDTVPPATPAASAATAAENTGEDAHQGKGPAADGTDGSAGPAPPTPPAASPPKSVTSNPAQSDDGARALALLEGRDPGKAAAPIPDSGSFAVQVGAFSSADAVKDVRSKLSAAGLKSYTEPLKTPQGDRTRVRLGPYATREAAEQARGRLKGIGLDGSVVPL